MCQLLARKKKFVHLTRPVVAFAPFNPRHQRTMTRKRKEKEKREKRRRKKEKITQTSVALAIWLFLYDFDSTRSLKSESLARLQLMHLLDQRASRSTSSIIDHSNASGTCTLALHRRRCVFARPSGIGSSSWNNTHNTSARCQFSPRYLVASRNALSVIRISLIGVFVPCYAFYVHSSWTHRSRKRIS